MGQSNKHPFTAIKTRLEPVYETREAGLRVNPNTGLIERVTKTFLIGHGQQLARQRLAAKSI